MKEKDNLHHMHIELTREQYATLCAKAKKSGLTKRALIVRLLEGQEIRERPTEELRLLREEVHRIGANINQIARSVNEGIATPEDAGHGLRTRKSIFRQTQQIPIFILKKQVKNCAVKSCKKRMSEIYLKLYIFHNFLFSRIWHKIYQKCRHFSQAVDCRGLRMLNKVYEMMYRIGRR